MVMDPRAKVLLRGSETASISESIDGSLASDGNGSASMAKVISIADECFATPLPLQPLSPRLPQDPFYMIYTSVIIPNPSYTLTDQFTNIIPG